MDEKYIGSYSTKKHFLYTEFAIANLHLPPPPKHNFS